MKQMKLKDEIEKNINPENNKNTVQEETDTQKTFREKFLKYKSIYFTLSYLWMIKNEEEKNVLKRKHEEIHGLRQKSKEKKKRIRIA